MGKQINYWMNYEDFLHIAQAALDSGCVIIRSDPGKFEYGRSLDMIMENRYRYYFYLPEAGELMSQQIPFQNDQRICYNKAGNTVIEAGFSMIDDKKKKITRSRLFVISGYYDENGEYIARPECLTKVYHRLVRAVKKVAPYTELTDHYISIKDHEYLQEREWKHKEYVSSACLSLREAGDFKLTAGG